MKSKILKYSLDIDFKNKSNLVLGENHFLKSAKIRHIVPRYGMYYLSSLEIIDVDNGEVLNINEHYLPIMYHRQASELSGHEVYAAIAILDTQVSDEVSINYHALGGHYSDISNLILEALDSVDLDSTKISYENLTSLPHEFNPVHHLHDIGDVYGFEQIVESLKAIKEAILEKDRESHQEIKDKIQSDLNTAIGQQNGALLSELNFHKGNLNNPHNVTKAQVGLSNVENLDVATEQETETNTGGLKYSTAKALKVLIDTSLRNPFDEWTQRVDNPHSVTKQQVGLDKVINLPIATEEELTLDVDQTIDITRNRYITPSQVGTLISTAVGSDIQAHLNGPRNPHQVTKSQVGLGSVENFDVATKQEAELGLVNNKMMTPLRVNEAIAYNVSSLLASHSSAKNNPHNVTKAQVGLSSVADYGILTTQEARSSTPIYKYSTPLTTKETISFMVVDVTNAHMSNTNNPHQVNKAHIGLSNIENYSIATKAEAEAGTLNTRYMTPLRAKEAITAQVLAAHNAHVANTNNPHGVTKSQVGLSSVENYGVATKAEAEAGTVTTKYMTPLRVKEAINSQIGSAFNSYIGGLGQLIWSHSSGVQSLALRNIATYDDNVEGMFLIKIGPSDIYVFIYCHALKTVDANRNAVLTQLISPTGVYVCPVTGAPFLVLIDKPTYSTTTGPKLSVTPISGSGYTFTPLIKELRKLALKNYP